jgi:NADPH2:quinone reductase
MKAICITPSGSLEPCERPVPVPGPGEVLIQVAAAGMNRADILQRKGLHPPPSGASDLPGLEVSGTIMAVGSGISESMIGECVCALLSGGGYAEYATAPADLCFPVPDHLDLVSSAGLPEALFTVTKNVFMIGQLRPDEHLLIHGGSSGIGTLAIQMAKSIGARVSVTAGTEEKCVVCLGLGADRAINYKESDFVEHLKDDPVDVVLDMVGGEYIKRDFVLMKSGGRHISIAYLGGSTAELDIPAMMRKRLTVTGSTLRHDTDDEKSVYADMIREVFWPDIVAEKIKPFVHATYPLIEALKAHEAFEEGHHAGKILLVS